MAGRKVAVVNGNDLVVAVATLAEALGLHIDKQFKVGRRIWGAERRIDIIITSPQTTQRLGVECKFQGVQGSAEEKIPATISDIAAWPIDGIVVFSGEGFSPNMRSFLIASGKAIDLEDLEPYLRLYFRLPLT